MNKLKIGGYILAAAGFIVGLASDAINKKETEDYINQKVLEREGEMVAYAVDTYVGDKIDEAVAKRFIAAGNCNPEEIES